MLAKAVGQAMKMLNVPTPSRASPAPTMIRDDHRIGARHITCGSEPARESGGSGNEDVECADAFASRLTPTMIRDDRRICAPHITCGSEPARESGGSGNENVEWADAFASRLTPTIIRDGHRICAPHITCGSELARESGGPGNENVKYHKNKNGTRRCRFHV